MSFNWSIDPVAFSLGNLTVKWYGLMYAASFICCYFLAIQFFKNDNKSAENLANIAIGYLIAGILGARIGTFLFYDLEVFLQNPSLIFAFRKGGMTSHGAFLGIIIFSFLIAKKYKQLSFWWLVDKMAICGALIVCFMRIGNFFNSELIGKPTDVAWSVVFTRVDLIPRHPTVLYEAFAYFSLFFLFLFLDKKYPTLKNGSLTAAFLLLLVPIRILIEFTKTDAIQTQMLSIPLIILGLAILIKNKFLLFKPN